MVDVAQVKLFGQNVGSFFWDSTYQLARFEYHPQFIGKGIEPSPLMMPVKAGRIYAFGELNRDVFNGLPGMLADALPDTYGRALFNQWLNYTGRTVGNPIEALCFLGSRCMGALEFEPATGPISDDQQKFEIDSLVQVAREALLNKENFGTNLKIDKKAAVAEILRLGTSAGGQRAKAIIAYNKETGEVRSGQIAAPKGFEYYIIKLDGVDAQASLKETGNYGRVEYSFAELAKACGIEMTECSLIEENGRAHFMTKRFDRVGSEKIHMQTLCGIAHYDYHLKRGYSYEQAFGVMRRLHLPYSEAEELFKRMVLNVVIRNQDDHTKNISFLMDKEGKWRLSPAYDILYSYNPNGTWTNTHQMSINGKFDNINRADLLSCAQSNSIKNAENIIDQVTDVASKWPQLALNCGVPKAMIDARFPHFQLNL